MVLLARKGKGRLMDCTLLPNPIYLPQTFLVKKKIFQWSQESYVLLYEKARIIIEYEGNIKMYSYYLIWS